MYSGLGYYPTALEYASRTKLIPLGAHPGEMLIPRGWSIPRKYEEMVRRISRILSEYGYITEMGELEYTAEPSGGRDR